jgi:nitronate monooxygenase
MLSTRFTRLFGIRHPVVQSGMRWLSRAELVAAVSEAGGLGLLSAHTFADGAALRAEIARTRERTANPFGVNLTLLPGARFDYEGYIQAVLACGVPVVETSGSNPSEVIARLKAGGVRVIHKCTAVKHAAKAVAAGADAVAIDGFECAGHTGMDNVSSLVLLRAAVRTLEVPVLGCGGFADGASLAAALALGAEGVAMGTRFMLTRESPLHPAIRQRMLQATERDTVQVGRSLGDPVRVLKTAQAEALLALERQGEAGRHAVHDGMAAQRWMDAFEAGDAEAAALPVGMCVGLIDEAPSCREVVEGLVRDAAETVRTRLAAMVECAA